MEKTHYPNRHSGENICYNGWLFMKMTRFEKIFVNREVKAKRNITMTQHCLQQVESQCIHNVLELGCGLGTVSAFLSENHEMNVTAADIDAEQIKLASEMYEKNNKLHFKEADATKLEFPNESFDLVIAQNVFHHIPKWEKAIKEISRVLRPGAYLFWTDFTLPETIKSLCQFFVKNYGLYTLREITDIFEKFSLQEHYRKKIPHGLTLILKKTENSP